MPVRTKHCQIVRLMAVILVTLMIGLLLGSCSDSGPSDDPSDEGKLVIGVCFQGLADEYIVRLKAAFEERANELGYIFLFSDGQMNGRIQVKQVENYIRQGVDCIVINPISMTECAPAIDAAVSAQIPIITLISTTVNQDMATSYVGSDSYYSGVLQADMAMQDLASAGEVVLLLGQMGHEAQIGRYQGVVDTLEGSGITITAMQSGNWSREQGYTIIENWIKANKPFDAILSQNDAMAIGAIIALREYNLLDEVKVYGIDGQEDALAYLRNGELAGTVLQDAEMQGYACAEIALQAAKGQPVDERTIIPYLPLRQQDVVN